MKPFLLFVSLLSSFATSAAASTNGWTTFENCHYLPNRANDGDSFHVRAAGKEYIFRLYFVDAPETDMRIAQRVADQAGYFHVTIPQTLQIGIEAERFTRETLARPFTVRTRFQDARGRSRLRRYFAFIQSDRHDLGEALVANGLARVYGAASSAPGLNGAASEWHKLEDLERMAQQEQVGGWGVAAGRLTARANHPAMSSEDAFEAFFHPKASPSSTPARSRMDINTASMEELEAVPGIGGVLAGRIIDARPFRGADDLRRVKGIGEKKYAAFRPYFN